MNRRQFYKLTVGVGSALAVASSPLTAGRGPRAAGRAAAVTYFGAFREVRPDSIRPAGWLRDMLKRQIDGLAENHAVQGYPYDTNLWDGVIPLGRRGSRGGRTSRPATSSTAWNASFW